MKKILFLDRDGTIIREAQDEMLNELHKFRFLPGAIVYLSKIAKELDYIFVLVSNQDGLGTASFPEKEFWPLHEFFIDTLAGENIHFDSINFNRHFPKDNSPFRKPGTAMLKKYLNGNYDLNNSIVIGDRQSDMELAKNLGAKGILIPSQYTGIEKFTEDMEQHIVLRAKNWEDIYTYLIGLDRKARTKRKTSETNIIGEINLDGTGIVEVDSGIGFFDHMLSQIAKHGSLDLFLHAKGDLYIDEHHTIEDTAIVLGELFKIGLGSKAGINRYGFCLPMDESRAMVTIDFGGRPWFEWQANFKREKIGEMSTEMFRHFFKSFSDHAKCNLHIEVHGKNEHHMIEAVFKAFAKAIKMAVIREPGNMEIPSTKGSL